MVGINVVVVFLAALGHSGLLAQALTNNFSLVYVSTGNCDAPLPRVELSTRFRPGREATLPFSQWSLTAYYTGNCSTVQTMKTDFAQYQLRVEVSPAASCHCVTLTSVSEPLGIVKNMWNNGTLWCGEEQSTGPLLCASEEQRRIFVSHVIQVKENLLDASVLRCDETSFSNQNTKDIAIAYRETFFGKCPTKTCFPLILEETAADVQPSVVIEFTLTVHKSQQLGCSNFSSGILLKATIFNSVHKGLMFFYDSNKISNDSTQTLEFLNNSLVNLTHNGKYITVPSRKISNNGLLEFSLTNLELLNRNMKLSWEQIGSSNCNTWSMDNVKVFLQHGNCRRIIFSDDFEEAKPKHWLLTNSVITNNTNVCSSVGAGSCLHFSSTSSSSSAQQNVSRHKATTPPLDLRIVSGVAPLPAPISVPDNMKCSAGLTLLAVKFELILLHFYYPSLCEDADPNGIQLTVGDTPVAYYVPIANTRWPGFNTNNKTITDDAGYHYPIFYPSQNDYAVATACVNTTGRNSLSVTWFQKNFSFFHSSWHFIIHKVSLGEVDIDDIEPNKDSELYALPAHIHHQFSNPDCITHNATALHFLGLGDTQMVNLTLNLTKLLKNPSGNPKVEVTPSATTVVFSSSVLHPTSISVTPTPIQPSCSPLPKWSSTSIPGCNVVLTDYSDSCSMHALATRICQCNGTWGPMKCRTPFEQDLDLINESPSAGLTRMLSLPSNHLNSSEWFIAIRSVFMIQYIINKEIVEKVVMIVDKLLKNRVDGINHNFLRLLDELFVMIKINVTVFLNDTGLSVQQVNPNSGRVVGIEFEGNYITLPPEMFANKMNPVTVASMYFRNLSQLLPVNPDSPVLSSVLGCQDCPTSNLSENVSVFFSINNTAKLKCVFANLKLELNDEFWSKSGCRPVQYENGSVLCSCNHLTHFAILLSPSVDEMPPEHQNILRVTSQVFVAVSMVFLLATILAFVLFKSLWSMRIYIHIMLCANLLVAQLVFVVGVERTENKTVCSVIAVLLHYLFLVVFMWMLMEGVVLYVVLVRVFVKHHARYIAGFTITAYGLPLLYMTIVTPLGFLVNTDNDGRHNYGRYDSNNQLIACWLRNDTHFVWAFIAPVILIIIVNSGFLVMALVITCRHYRRQKCSSEYKKAKHWLKVIITLTVVMGVAWVPNVLYFNIHLIFVAYIMTIFIAGQGIIIFILFVPLSKQVREVYFFWWKTRVSQSRFLSKVFSTQNDQVVGLSPKKLFRSKTAMAKLNGNYKLGALDKEKLVMQEYRSPSNDEMGAIHLVYEKEKRPETQVTTIKDNSAKQKWAPVKRTVTRRATITNVYGDEVYTNTTAV